jgi:excinuclease UvrABC nuclease subunit
MYSEMKMCLAPCFAGCTKEDYDVEVQKLVQFLDTGGGSLRNSFEQERESASEQLDFERAAALHKKIEKLDDALRGSPELPRRIQDLNAVILQRSAEEQSIAIYAVRGGWLAEPAFIRFAEIAGQPRSAEHIFREYLERATPPPPQGALPANTSALSAGKNTLSEHLWLVARWYYSNPREGEIFFRDKDWPYRRIMRGCSRLLAPKAETDAGNAPPAPSAS